VLETGSNTWTRPAVTGTGPTERADTPMVFDPRGSRMIVFGGWANRWFNDLFICKVGEVVGPPTQLNPSRLKWVQLQDRQNVQLKVLGFLAVALKLLYVSHVLEDIMKYLEK